MDTYGHIWIMDAYGGKEKEETEWGEGEEKERRNRERRTGPETYELERDCLIFLKTALAKTIAFESCMSKTLAK